MSHHGAQIACNICGSAELDAYRRRSDGVVVLRCRDCGMGVIQQIPERLSALYEDEYYSSGSEAAKGYSDYSFTAEHSTAWAASLARLLVPFGRVLDIGCADGHLLNKLLSTHECYGIEVNPRMAEASSAAGTRIIAADIFDNRLPDLYGGFFDVVLAMAVLEHVADFRGAVRIALELLKPGGVFLFEVPLISSTHDNTAWFTSSLEHVYYPSETALRRLFNQILALPLAGSEIPITDYASTFIGIASKDPRRGAELDAAYRRLVLGPVAELVSAEEKLFRALLDLVHAGRTSPEHLSLLEGLARWELNPWLLRRLAQLWKRDQERLESSLHFLREVEQARNWQAEEARRRGDAVVKLEVRLQQEARERHAAEEKLSELSRQLDGITSSSRWRFINRIAGVGRTMLGLLRGLILLSSLKELRIKLRNLRLLWKVWRSARGRRILRCYFNRSYYLQTSPDVARAGIPPFLHYVLQGFREERRSSAQFDPDYYLARHAELAPAGINPLVHFAAAVASENDTCLISVVIPSFNYGIYVEDAVRSVLRQTFTRYEIIVVEGGSTDPSTVEKVRALERQNLPKTRFLYQPGRRLVGENRNWGIQAARGQFICCLDADDLLKPVYLEVAAFLAEGYGYDVVYPSVQSFGNSNFRWTLADASFPEIAAENQISTVALFRKGAWAQVGGFRDWGVGAEYVPEDWEFFVRLLGHGFRAKSIHEPLMLYRVHESGLMSACKSDKVYQRQAIENANATLLGERPAPPPGIPALQPIDPGIYLQAAEDDAPGFLLALPFVTIGGAENVLRMVAQALIDRGHRVIVITTLVLHDTIKDDTGAFEKITPYVYRLPFLFKDQEQRWADFVRYLIVRYNIWNLMIAGCEFLYRMLPEIAQAFPDLRIIDQLFNDEVHLPNNRRYSTYIDRTIVPSAALADRLVRQYGERPGRIAVIPHGIDVAGPRLRQENRPAAFAALGLPPAARGKFLVSFFGRHSEEKAPDVFVEIARRLKDYDELFFCMTGEGPLRSLVLRLIEDYGLGERLHAPGFVDDHRMLMELSDVVVVPSRLDGMPLVVLEAQALSKPVVASAVGAIGEMLVDGETGFLCQPGDAEAFCERILELLRQPEKRLAMGAAAQQAVCRRHSAESMIAAYFGILGQGA